MIWCCERFGVTSIRLHRFTKSLLPRMAPTTARPLAGMIRSLVNSIFIFFMMTASIVPTSERNFFPHIIREDKQF